MTSQERYTQLCNVAWAMLHSIPGSPVGVSEALACVDRTALYMLSGLMASPGFAGLENNQARADVLVGLTAASLTGQLPEGLPHEDIVQEVFVKVRDFLGRDDMCDHVKGQDAYVSQKMLYWFMALRNGEDIIAMSLPGARPYTDFLAYIDQEAVVDMPYPDDLPPWKDHD